MKKSKLKLTLARIAIAVAIGLMGGWSMYLYCHTLVDPRVPIVVGVATALLTLPLCLNWWKHVASATDRWINIICHIVTGFVTGIFLLFTMNYYMPQAGSEHIEQAEVVRKYSEQKNRYRRVGRMRTIPAGKYTVYHAEIRFSNGRTKEISLTLSEYNRTRAGSTLTYTLATGLFGIPVFHR